MLQRRRYRPASTHPAGSRPTASEDSRAPRSIGRRALLRALSEEYEYGDAISKLYVALLAKAVVEQEPRLLRPPSDPRVSRTEVMRNLERCGVRPNDTKTAPAD
jgi:hypothetical protein